MASESLLVGNEQEKRIIDFSSIKYIIVKDYLSTFFLTNNQKFVCSKPLCSIRNFLPYYFFQINKSCIINLHEIISIRRNKKQVTLSDTSEHVVSIRRIKPLFDTLASQCVTFAR